MRKRPEDRFLPSPDGIWHTLPTEKKMMSGPPTPPRRLRASQSRSATRRPGPASLVLTMLVLRSVAARLIMPTVAGRAVRIRSARQGPLRAVVRFCHRWGENATGKHFCKTFWPARATLYSGVVMARGREYPDCIRSARRAGTAERDVRRPGRRARPPAAGSAPRDRRLARGTARRRPVGPTRAALPCIGRAWSPDRPVRGKRSDRWIRARTLPWLARPYQRQVDRRPRG